MRLLWRPYAHPAFGDSRPLVMFGAERSATMNVLLANAAMHASHTNPKLKPVAARYYNSVLTSMRTAIDTRAVKGNEDRLLLMANFSLLFEVNEVHTAYPEILMLTLCRSNRDGTVGMSLVYLNTWKEWLRYSP